MPRSLGWRIGFGSAYAIEQTTFALNLVRLLRRERADVLHIQDPLVAVIVQRARRVGLIRTRTILAHGTEESSGFLSRIQHLQHLAPWHLEQMRERGAWRPDWTAIPNFIDTERFTPAGPSTLRRELGIPEDAMVVLTAAAIKRHHKRIDHLLVECVRLRQSAPELPLWLIVAGGWEPETEWVVGEGTRLLGDRVRFLVRFPRERMPELYRSADVFVLCSLFEMMPIALIEAAATGLPCVVHNHPILEWMTGDGGIRIDMAAPGELSQTLERLYLVPDLRRELGRSARVHCQTHFSRDSVVDQIVAYYRQVLRLNRNAKAAMNRGRGLGS
jgi:glycosyltransferase involved in cell wall biosynthesis